MRAFIMAVTILKYRTVKPAEQGKLVERVVGCA